MNENKIPYEVYSPQLWKVIHIISKSYVYTSPESLKVVSNFFNCLFNLMPSDEQAQYNIQQFLSIYPIEKYFQQTGFQSFYWSYLLHDYMNVVKYGSIKSVGLANKVLTLQQAADLYEEKKISKSLWGNAFWFMIHFFGLIVNTSDEKRLLLQLIFDLRYLMPCPKCKKHLTETLEWYNENNVFNNNNKIDIFNFTVDLHNSVNKLLNKNLISYQTARMIYINKMNNY